MHAQSGRWPKNTTLIFLHQVLTVRFIDACAPEENEKKLSGLSDEDRAMAWKQLRSSTLSAKWRAMCTGALIPLLTATVIGVLYIITYVCYQTIYNCQFHDTETIPEKAQWIRTLSDVTGCVFLHLWFYGGVLLLFRPYQVMGLNGKLFLVAFLLFSLDAIYRVALQLLGISRSKPFCVTKDSAERFVPPQYMLEKLSLDKCISYSNKKAVFGSKNYIAEPFLFHNRHLRTILHLPDVRQARCERKATYGNLLASHRGCS